MTETYTRSSTHPTCEANLPTLRVVDYGFERIRCHQWRGLRTFFDADGKPRYACAAGGHMADVVRRFGAVPYGDALDVAKVRREVAGVR